MPVSRVTVIRDVVPGAVPSATVSPTPATTSLNVLVVEVTTIPAPRSRAASLKASVSR